MHSSSYLFSLNTPFIEEIYKKYLNNPDSIDISWHKYFESITPHDQHTNQYASQPVHTVQPIALSDHAGWLIDCYRRYGHMQSNLDPLGMQEINACQYIVQADIQTDVPIDIPNRCYFLKSTMAFSELLETLKRTYSGNLGFEIDHLENIEEKNWFYKEIEGCAGQISNMFTTYDKQAFLNVLIKTTLFEQYLHTKFVGAKRFSVEGSETAILALQEIVRLSAVNGISEIAIGMAHRGRLNTLVNVLHKAHSQIFASFMGYTTYSALPSFLGDVKYHLGYSSDIKVDESNVHISLAQNPSHLESINCVVMGKVRAKQDLLNDTAREKIISVLVHGDASITGQGSVMEALSMSKISAYNTGGTIHLIINNQIGFTTNPSNDRGTRYCSDIARGFDMPIIHVNGNDVEAVVYAVRLAMAYKVRFKKDIFIDIVGYRKYGHNEGDEPAFTQPLMYKKIYSSEFKDVLTSYTEQLIENRDITNAEVQEIVQTYTAHMDAEYTVAKQLASNPVTPIDNITVDSVWNSYYTKHLALEQKIYSLYKHTTNDIGCVHLGDVDITLLQNSETGVDIEILKSLGVQLAATPVEFHLNGKIARQFEARKKMMAGGTDIDWGTGEALAIASLIIEGINIRFTGQDVERGTFSHRHAVLTDQENGSRYIPFNNIHNPTPGNTTGNIYIANSSLSELGVLAYEYGYATSNPQSLTIWEAQFGDFANGAQMVIDQYISAAESKWGILNNLVMLLPHGYEGQGPEHSSARLERFLQMCAQNNVQICNCTTPASLFHVLRRQVLQDLRKPLIIMTPKSLLRHKLAVSKIEDMSKDSRFQPVICSFDATEQDNKPHRIIFCSGKVYYDLLEHRTKSQDTQSIGLVRIEQLYPFPIVEISRIIAANQNAEIVWCQEEPKNMGAYSFVKPLLEDAMSTFKHSLNKVKYVGRNATATTATGFSRIHQSEVEKYLNDAFAN